MRITVAAAHAAAQALIAAATNAQAAGATDFDLLDALGAEADASMNELAKAIADVPESDSEK